MGLKIGTGMRWPDGKRIALMVTFDLDMAWLRFSREGRKPLSFGDRSRGDYAIDEGLKRCLEVMDDQKVKGTFFVVGKVAEDYPNAVKEICEHGHELGYHGWEHEDSLDMTKEEERANMEKAEAAFLRAAGKKPRGARGCWNMAYTFTPELLRERGYIYSSVMKNCDFAWMYPGEGEKPLVELPTEHSFDDVTYFYFTFNAPEHRSNYPIDYIFQYWKDAFDELADEGDKVMVLKLHPQLIGRASRAELLRRFIRYAKENGAWVATCEQVADYTVSQAQNVPGLKDASTADFMSMYWLQEQRGMRG